MPTAVSQTLRSLDACDGPALADFRRAELNVPSQQPPSLPPAVALLAAHLMEACVWVAILESARYASLAGRLGARWIWAWTVCLAALVPLRRWAARSRDRQAKAAGKQFSGWMTPLVAIVELALGSAILTTGAGDALLFAVFLAWAVLAVAAGWCYACERDRWSMARLSLGSDPTVPRPGSEEEEAGQYRDLPDRMDRWSVRLNSFGPYGWLLAGGLALLPALSEGISSARLAIGLGGVWLVYQALRAALHGVSKLIVAAALSSAVQAHHDADDMEPAAVVETETGRTVVQGRDRIYRWHAPIDNRQRTTKRRSAA